MKHAAAAAAAHLLLALGLPLGILEHLHQGGAACLEVVYNVGSGPFLLQECGLVYRLNLRQDFGGCL